jgi:hypothetical protein
MKSLLEQIKKLDQLIRQLQKLASRMKAGQIVDAHRECNNLIGALMKNREDLIKEAEQGEDNGE